MKTSFTHTDFTSFDEDVVSRYFCAWKTYDINSLSTIFSADCEYNINDGIKVFRGLEEIKRYWERNRNRQRDLELDWKVLASSDYDSTVVFSAGFFDVDERQFQAVSGQIRFIISPSSGRIVKLLETYIKRIDHYPMNLLGMSRRVLAPIYHAISSGKRNALVSFDSVVNGLFYFFLIVAALMLIVNYVEIPIEFSYLAIPKFWDGLLKLGIPVLSGQDIAQGKASIISILEKLIIPATVTVPILAYIRDLRRRRDVKRIELYRFRTDLDVMVGKLRGAARAVIFSGDFDFIGKNRELLELLTKLSISKSLVFVSYKSRVDVINGNSKSADALNIIQRLEGDNKIHYLSGVRLHLTLVETDNISQVLYRFYGEHRHGEREYVLVVEGRHVARGLVNAVRNLIAANLRGLGNVDVRQKKKSAAIFVTGRTMSGKSTLARAFEKRGVEVVSASRVIRNVSKSEGSRAAMLAAGQAIIDSDGYAGLGRYILNESKDNKLVLYDGVRPIETINFLKAHYETSFIIHLAVDVNTRKLRYGNNSDKSILFEELEKNPIEQMADAAERYAHIKIVHELTDDERDRLVEVVIKAC